MMDTDRAPDRPWLALAAAAMLAAAIVSLIWSTSALLIGAALAISVWAAIVHKRRERQTLALLETKIVALEERTRSIALLGKMSDRLQTAVHPDEAYAAIAVYARQLFPAETGALCIVDAARQLVDVVAAWGEPATDSVFPVGDCRSFPGAQMRAVSPDDAAGTCRHVSPSQTTHTTCLRVTCDGDAIGVVCFDRPLANKPEAPTGADPYALKLATAFAEQIGLALTNVRLKELLRSQAGHDPLTGLHNRRFLEDGFHRELMRAERKQGPVGVLMLDLDHFKAFNDAHGHVAGDSLLRAFAKRIQSEIRASDIACRYGGEEFAVILPDTTVEQALTRAEQIREATRHMTVQFDGASLSEITVSIGVAACPQHGASPDALLRAADAALYTAKANGRNRAEAAATPRILPLRQRHSACE